jgi:hypothetical protein
MPGQTPLRNTKFTNTPDFDNQSVKGVLRTFIWNNYGAPTKTLQTVDLWTVIEMPGNSVVTIPVSGMSAAIGDEIIIIPAAGTVSFTVSGGAVLLSSSLYVLPNLRPARLIYAGSNTWILAGAKTAYYVNSLLDCCGEAVSGVYSYDSTIDNATVSPENVTAYANAFGTSLFSLDTRNRVTIDSLAYRITSGIITESECELLNYNNEYTLYDSMGDEVAVYYYEVIDIGDDAAVLGQHFKRQILGDVYICNRDDAVDPGTLYRVNDMYGLSNPICFGAGGVVIATDEC